MRFHRVLRRHWKKIAWSTMGTPIGVLGTQIDKPLATYCYGFAAFCAIMAGIYIRRGNR